MEAEGSMNLSPRSLTTFVFAFLESAGRLLTSFAHTFFVVVLSLS